MVLALCTLATFCYWLGGRRHVRLVATRGFGARQWRAIAFTAALLLVAAILSEPLDSLVRERFWLRTTQLVVLVMVAAPLIVLGAPWPRLARLLGRSPRGAAVGSRLVAVAACVILNGSLILSYVPFVFRATYAPGPLRQLAQLLLLGAGIFFWSQVIAQPPGRCALNHVERVVYLVLSSVVIRLVGLVLGFASAPFYGIPLVDQQMGAGVLLVPGVFTDLIVLIVCLYMWLGQDER
jgi:cytochrome c oxidase assembly factor CtaG